jgi:hypothetical protein
MNKINLYPQTSCFCGDCYNPVNRTQSSLNSGLASRCSGIPTIDRNDDSYSGYTCSADTQSFECKNRQWFGTDIEPICPIKEPKKGNNPAFRVLNPQAMTEKYSTGFNIVKCGNKNPYGVKTGCPADTYSSWDPRLFDAARAQYLTLDRPPIDGNVPLKDMYRSGKGIRGGDSRYGSGYTSYDNIREGQITYYIDDTIKDALFEPVFGERAHVSKDIYQDPMGSIKPEYIRTPILNTENPVTTDRTDYPYNLSFIQDTQSHREDIMSKQMAVQNQSKFSARYY